MPPNTLPHVSIPEPLDSMHEVAERVGCHPRTIARAAARGELNPIRFNSGLLRFRRSEVDRWIAAAEGKAQ